MPPRSRGGAAEQPAAEAKWEKVLWKRHASFPDNYTDYEKTFLEQLVINRNYVPKNYATAVGESLSIARQISVVCSLYLPYLF